MQVRGSDYTSQRDQNIIDTGQQEAPLRCVNPHSVPPEAAAMLVAAASTPGKMADADGDCKYLVNKKTKKSSKCHKKRLKEVKRN
jgi:hypothetical protein